MHYSAPTSTKQHVQKFTFKRYKKQPSDVPDSDQIQAILEASHCSPNDKVVHISVVNSTDNLPNNDDISQDAKDSKDVKGNKAAVPILDFTGLPEDEKDDGKSASIGSIFDQDSHLDLSSKRLTRLIMKSDFSSLLNLREEALKAKESKERSKIDTLLKTAKISPRTGKTKEYELEKWITKERAEISKTKKIIEEARKKTEDILKEAQINGDFMKQIMSDKVLTPREGFSVRSGMNSARRKFEKQNKEEEQEINTISPRSDRQKDTHKLYHEKEKQLPKKEFESNPNSKHENKSETDALVSVDTPQIDSDGNSSFNNTKKIKFDPNMLNEKLSDESQEPKIDNNIPINVDIKIKDDPSANKSESSEPSQLPPEEENKQSLSRKKSEQQLKDFHSKILIKDNKHDKDLKLTITPTPQTKPSIVNPFNSDNFFTQNFDEQEMEAAIEQLKNSSGKMYGPSSNNDSTNVLVDKKDKIKDNIDSLKKLSGLVKYKDGSSDEITPSSNNSKKLDNSDSQDDHDANNLIKKAEQIRIKNEKESRNQDIKETKNKDSPPEPAKYEMANDVDMLRKSSVQKPDLADSRNDKRVVSEVIKSSNTNESLKEDFLLDNSSEKLIESDTEDKIEDGKNITGETSLYDHDDVTPGKNAQQLQDSDLGSDDKSGCLDNSDSKYATVSILSELSKKEQLKKKHDEEKELDTTNDTVAEKETANKVADFILQTMMAEVKAELFPQRPLFLLTADFDKIDLEQAIIYLNDMTIEKEAALIDEYIRATDPDNINPWDLDKHDRDSDDSKMFSESGKLVLYERKGISTDLFSIERYVDELATEVDNK